MDFAIKMLLDYTYGLLNLLAIKCNHFNSLFLTVSEFKYSNFGGKQLEFIFSCQSKDTMPLGMYFYLKSSAPSVAVCYFLYFS